MNCMGNRQWFMNILAHPWSRDPTPLKISFWHTHNTHKDANNIRANLKTIWQLDTWTITWTITALTFPGRPNIKRPTDKNRTRRTKVWPSPDAVSTLCRPWKGKIECFGDSRAYLQGLDFKIPANNEFEGFRADAFLFRRWHHFEETVKWSILGCWWGVEMRQVATTTPRHQRDWSCFWNDDNEKTCCFRVVGFLRLLFSAKRKWLAKGKSAITITAWQLPRNTWRTHTIFFLRVQRCCKLR